MTTSPDQAAPSADQTMDDPRKLVSTRPSDGNLTVQFDLICETITQPSLAVYNAMAMQMISRWALDDDDLLRTGRYLAARILVQRLSTRFSGINPNDNTARKAFMNYAEKVLESTQEIVLAELRLALDGALKMRREADERAKQDKTKEDGDDRQSSPSDRGSLH